MTAGKRIRRTVVAAGAAVALGASLFAGLGPDAGFASSHREAPAVSGDPQVDVTDVYAFRSPDRPNTVTLISAWIPFEEPAGGPNFYTWQDGVHYDLNIDNDGDARAEIVFRWIFQTHHRNPDSFLFNNGRVTSLDDPNLLIFQTYDLYRIQDGRARLLVDDAVAVPSRVGKPSMPHYDALEEEGIVTFGAKDNRRTIAGQADDPFFLDLRVFNLAYGADLSQVGDDTLDGFNVNYFAIQVPRHSLRGDADPVIGVWTDAGRRSVRIQGEDGSLTTEGKFVQVSRLGMPLVNEVVVPVGAKDYFNASRPKDDEQFLGKVNDPELPHVLNALYGLPVPDSNDMKPGIQRDDLITVFLTGLPDLNKPAGVEPAEMLRLNMNTPLCGMGGAPACNTLGVIKGDPQGFPNGRRLDDDIIDVSLRVVEGVLLPDHHPAADTLGDAVDENDVAFRDTFPYLALPHSGSDPDPH